MHVSYCVLVTQLVLPPEGRVFSPANSLAGSVDQTSASPPEGRSAKLPAGPFTGPGTGCKKTYQNHNCIPARRALSGASCRTVHRSGNWMQKPTRTTIASPPEGRSAKLPAGPFIGLLKNASATWVNVTARAMLISARAAVFSRTASYGCG